MILAIIGGFFLSGGVAALVVVLAHRAAEAAPHRPLLDAGPDPDPVVQHFEETGMAFEPQRSAPFIASDHPTDCAELCCWEDRLTELHDAFDWHAAEHEIRKTR